MKSSVSSAACRSPIGSTAREAIDRLFNRIRGSAMLRLTGRCALLACALLALLAPAPAQEYPSRTITIVVPLAPGTGMDVIARLYGEQLSKTLGKPVIVENKPGAGFIVGTQTVLAA